MLRRVLTLLALTLILGGLASVGASAGEPDEVGELHVVKTPRLANLWLCTEDTEACHNKASGVEEVNFDVELRGTVDSTAKGEPQSIGSFEFEVRYDTKLVSVDVSAGDLFNRPEVSCESLRSEGSVNFRCVTKGKPTDAPRGPGSLAKVRVRAQPDVYSKLIASQDNGVLTELLNQDCQLSDLQGHPIPLNDAGGIIDPCGDTSITIRYLEGDIHADCRVDVIDQQQIAFRWGSHEGQLLYNSRYDLEPSSPKLGDGDIDAKDLQTVFGRHGSTCKRPHPAQDPVNPKSCVSSSMLIAGYPGVNLLDPSTLLVALPILNPGPLSAEDVTLTQVALSTGARVVPASLPFSLGDIPSETQGALQAQFAGSFEPLGSYLLTIEGRYLAGDTFFCFRLEVKVRVPPAAPGSDTLSSIEVPSNFITDAPFPPLPTGEEGLNPPRGLVPTAPFEPGGPPPGSTIIDTSGGGGGGTSAEGGAAGAAPIVFNANNSVGMTGLNTIAEPSGDVSGGGVVFATANTTSAAFSTNGVNFTQINATTIFPNDKVGFCCDQVVQYAPSIDRFFWLIQGNRGYRLAMASPASIISSNGTAWTYWNLTAQLFGQPVGTGFDYPEMSLGNNFLYMSWDAGFPCAAGCNAGFQVARISLAGLQAGGTVTVEFTDPANGTPWGSHIMHDTRNEVFWAGHNNNKNVRIFSLREDSNTYFWRDRGISSWANNSPTSLTPDGQDWLGKNFSGATGGGAFPGNAIIGGTRVGNQLWFAWSAGTDTNLPQAHIEIAVFDRNDDFDKIQQVQVWNPDYAFAYPSLSTNACTNEVGMSFEFGGGGNYENHVVGFWGDFIAWITTNSNVGTNRFGDYVTIRKAAPTEADPGNMFAAFGYGLRSGSPNVDVHYVQFGRPASSCIIIG